MSVMDQIITVILSDGWDDCYRDRADPNHPGVKPLIRHFYSHHQQDQPSPTTVYQLQYLPFPD